MLWATFMKDESLESIRSCLRGRVLCSIIRTILNVVWKERLEQRTKSLSPTCSRRLSRETPVLHARYSALAAIIIFSLGIWCHKFDLVISFTGCTRAGNDGEDAGAAEKKEKRADTQHRKASAKIGNVLRERLVSRCCQKRYLISLNIYAMEYYLERSYSLNQTKIFYISFVISLTLLIRMRYSWYE